MLFKFLLFSILGFFILRWILKKAFVLMFWTVGKQLRKEMEKQEQERFDFEQDGMRIRKPKQARGSANDGEYIDFEEVK